MKKKPVKATNPEHRIVRRDMSLDEIQEMIKMLSKSNVSELSIERENFKITLRTHNPYSATQVVTQVAAPPPVAAPPAAPPPAPENAPKTDAPKADAADNSKYITIKSPMIGTFYRSPGQGKPAFVNVGDEIKPGTVLCIVEAMKLFNEIESEHTGRIVKILVENAKAVEYDQPLFLIEPM